MPTYRSAHTEGNPARWLIVNPAELQIIEALGGKNARIASILASKCLQAAAYEANTAESFSHAVPVSVIPIKKPILWALKKLDFTDSQQTALYVNYPDLVNNT